MNRAAMVGGVPATVAAFSRGKGGKRVRKASALGLTALAVAALAVLSAAQQTVTQRALISVEKIWDRAPHSAFTDLVEFKGELYCAFREGSGHVPGADGTNGTIRVVASRDRQNWRSVALLREDGVDLRDPKLSVTPDRKLMVLMGGSTYHGATLVKYATRVSFSDDGVNFTRTSPVAMDEKVKTDRDWLWRVVWHRGVGYGVLYQGQGDAIKAHLVETRDGVSYRHVAQIELTGRPSEAAVGFMPNDEMIVLIRRDGESKNGFVGTSRAPYTAWQWKELPARIAAPQFVRFGNGKLLAVSRGYLADGKYNTHLAWFTTAGEYRPFLTLPSGGDTSYAGMVVDGDGLLVSYYSSHEGKSAVYTALINLKALAAE
jgi:hypothetical protein